MNKLIPNTVVLKIVYVLFAIQILEFIVAFGSYQFTFPFSFYTTISYFPHLVYGGLLIFSIYLAGTTKNIGFALLGLASFMPILFNIIARILYEPLHADEISAGFSTITYNYQLYIVPFLYLVAYAHFTKKT